MTLHKSFLFNAALIYSAFTFTVAAYAQTSAQLPDAPSTTAHEDAAPTPTGPTVIIDTTMGQLVCKLFDKEAPVTVANFVELAKGTKPYVDPTTAKKVNGVPFYNGTAFHRVIPGFMIQGGDKLGNGMGDAGYYFADEFTPSLRFDIPGRMAMANSGPNTNGSQFFITETAQPQLNGKYNIFGQCDEHSVLLVSTIARVERNSEDKPITPVVMNKVTIIPAGQPVPPAPGTATPPTAPLPAPRH